MTIKPLTEAFAEKIADLNEKYFPDGWNLNVLKSSFNSGRFFVFGAFNEKEELVAYISYSVAADSADIEDVFVIPEERGKKISSSLADKTLKDLKEKGVREVFLEVREKNSVARNLYEKFGFNIVSVRKKYYNDGENAVIYKKEL